MNREIFLPGDLLLLKIKLPVRVKLNPYFIGGDLTDVDLVNENDLVIFLKQGFYNEGLILTPRCLLGWIVLSDFFKV